METIAKINNCHLPPQQIYSKQKAHRGRIKELFAGDLRKTTILVISIWFIAFFIYFGTVLVITEVIKYGSTCLGDSLGTEDTSQMSPCALDCRKLDTKKLSEVFYNSLAELLAAIAVAFLADWVGRKAAFLICFLMHAVLSVFLIFCAKGAIMLMMLFAWRGFGMAVAHIAYLYTLEAYPTHVRSTGMGLASCACRIGGLLTPYVAQVLSKQSMFLTLMIYGVMSLIGALCSFLLPIETKGRHLA